MLQGVRVLVVDDHDDIRELLRAIFKDAGAVVEASSDAKAAYVAFQHARPDVVVSDIGLPDESGYDLMRKIRALAPEQGGATPALALTAHAFPEDRREALRAGFDVHASKPIHAADLLRLVARLARRTD